MTSPDSLQSPSTDLVASSQAPAALDVDVLAVFRQAILGLDDQRKALAEAGDVEALAHGADAISALYRDFGTVRRDILRDVAAGMDGRWLDVDGIGRLERVRESANHKWDDHAARSTAAGLIEGRVCDANGVLIEQGVIAAVLMEFAPYAALNWRVTPFKDADVDVDAADLRDKAPLGAWTVKLPKRADA